MQVRCVHCHESMEISGDSDFSRLTCSSCGGNFSLVGEQTITHQTVKPKSLGHFQLIDQVGVGAFGSVWKARDNQLDRTVAVKVPRKGDLSQEEVEQFLREARAAAQLRHPNIVGVHEVGRDHDSIYIVSDFVEGANLDDWLTGQQLTARQASELVAKIAAALHHAHQAGVIHRDLKPSNIMLDLDGEPHLMDFGLARQTSRDVTMTMEGRILGTPAYMSPEQARGESHTADHRSDVYSLGVVLFKLLTGELPFRGTPQMLVVQIQREDPPSPRQLNARVPRALETICLKCLEKNPERRYETAAELAADLRRWLAGEAIHARPAGRIERAWRWCKRRPVLATVIGFLILIAAVAPLFVLYESSLRRDAELAQAKEKVASNKFRGLLYIEEMRRAESSWQDGNVPLVRSILDRYRQSEFRGPEWYYLARLCGQAKPFRAVEVGGDFSRLAFSHDESQLIAFGQKLGDVFRYEFSADSKLVSDGKYPEVVQANAEYFPDGRLMVQWKEDKSLSLLDAQSDPLVEKGKIEKGYSSTAKLAIAAQKKILAITDNNQTIDVWKIEDGQVQALPGIQREVLFEKEKINQLVLSSDACYLAVLFESISVNETESDTQKSTCLELWNVNTQKQIAATIDSVERILMSPDGKYIAAWESDSPEVHLYSLEDRKHLRSLRGQRGVFQNVAFSKQGPMVASSSDDGSVSVWDFSDRPPRILPAHRNWASAVTFSADGKWLASSGADNIIRIWRVDQGINQICVDREYRGHVMPVTHLAFSDSGNLLASRSLFQQSVKIRKIVHTPNPEMIKASQQHVDSVAISPDATLIASASRDDTLRIWNTADASTTPREISGFQFSSGGYFAGMSMLAFRPSQKAELAVADKESVKIYDCREKDSSGVKLVDEFAKHDANNPDHFRCLAYSPDGRWLAAGMDAGVVQVWNLADKKHETVVLKADNTNSFVRTLDFSPDGCTLVVSVGKFLTFWNVPQTTYLNQQSESQWKTASPPLQLSDRIWAAAFHPTSDEMTLSVGLNRLMRVQRAPDGSWKSSSEATFTGHTGMIIATAILPDGLGLSAGSDLAVRYWNTKGGQERFSFTGHTASILSLSVSRDGNTFVSSDDAGYIRIWRIGKQEEVPAANP